MENSVRGGAVLTIFSGLLLLVGLVALLGVWAALAAAGSVGSLVGAAVLHAGLTARFAQER